MQKIKQILIALFLLISAFPLDDIYANEIENGDLSSKHKILESSHEELPEGFHVEKSMSQEFVDEGNILYGFSREIEFSIEIKNDSSEDVTNIFIQDSLEELSEFLTEESLENELSIGEIDINVATYRNSDGETLALGNFTVEDIKKGIYFDLKSGSETSFKFKVELKTGLGSEDLKTVQNTVLVNNIEASVEMPVMYPDIKVDKQSIAYRGETPYKEPEGVVEPDEPEEEPEEDPQPDEPPEEDEFSLRSRSFLNRSEEEFEILEMAEPGSKIRYAIVVENGEFTYVEDYKVSDISLAQIIPEYAQYVYDEVSVYMNSGDENDFSLKDNPDLEGYRLLDKIETEKLQEGYELSLNGYGRYILVFDILLNDDLPEELEFIENIVEHNGGKVIEKTPIKPEDGDKPTDPEDGEKPTDPEDGEKPTDPEDGEKPTEPEDGEKPTDPEDGEKPTEPEDGEKPTDSEDGEKPTDPEDGEKPTEPEDGEKPTDSEDGEKPTEPEDGEKPTDPEDGEKPTEPEDGEKPTDPEDGEKPTDSEDGENTGPFVEDDQREEHDRDHLEVRKNEDSVNVPDKLPATGMKSWRNLSLSIMVLGFVVLLLGKFEE